MTRISRNELGRVAPACALALVLGAARTGLAQEAAPVPASDASADVLRPDETADEAFGDEIVWMTSGAGYGFFDLTTIEKRTDVTADVVASRVGGLAGHVGAGIRVLTMTLGVRVTVNDLHGTGDNGRDQDFVLWTLDGELGFKLPLGRVEPFFLLGGGYSTFGGFGDALAEVGQGLDVSGANVRGGIGLDYYFSPLVSVGLRGTAELLFLNRRGVSLRDLTTAEQVNTVGQARARALEADGSSVGTGYRFYLGPGLHF